nr:hypothetical protein [uncultured Bacteroides sp.]
MAEYSREQRNQLSRAVANSGIGGRQLKRIMDNRFSQLKTEKAIDNINVNPKVSILQRKIFSRAMNNEENDISIEGLVPPLTGQSAKWITQGDTPNINRTEAGKHDYKIVFNVDDAYWLKVPKTDDVVETRNKDKIIAKHGSEEGNFGVGFNLLNNFNSNIKAMGSGKKKTKLAHFIYITKATSKYKTANKWYSL